MLIQLSSISSVTDTQGNTYVPAVSDSPGQNAIWYATNIQGGADTVTENFSGSTSYTTLYIHEYSGIATSSALDVTSFATGNSTSVSSGSATTTQANELIFGFADVGMYVSAAGSGFTLRQTAGGNGSEDEVVSSTGSYAATFTQASGSDCCVYTALMATFKAASGGGGGGMVADPSISPASGAYTSPQTITITDSTTGATICYTTNGTAPSASTPGTCSAGSTTYTGSFPLTIPSGGATVKALGTLSGDANSNVTTNTYTLSGGSPAATPTFSPGTGNYSSAQTVTVSTTSSNAIICWNTTGSPGPINGGTTCPSGSTLINGTSGTVTVSASETLYAVAGGTGYTDSNVSPATYTINGAGPSVYYYIEDSLGSSRVITDSSGNLCYDADFYPFGGERAYTTNCSQNYKFTGKERDSESNLDNFGARYMSSQFGRFMSPDPLHPSRSHPLLLDQFLADPQNWNKYAYSLDDPVTYRDLGGHFTGDDHERMETNALVAHGFSPAAANIAAKADRNMDNALNMASGVPVLHHFFPTQENPQHGERADHQTKEEAQKVAKDFISSKSNDAAQKTLQGDVKGALTDLGQASHTAQDIVRHDFEEAGQHPIGEAPATPTEVQKATQATDDVLDQFTNDVYEQGLTEGLSFQQITGLMQNVLQATGRSQ